MNNPDEYNRGLQDGVRMETTGENAYQKAKINKLEEQNRKLTDFVKMAATSSDVIREQAVQLLKNI